MSFRLESEGIEPVEFRHAPFSLESWSIGSRDTRDVVRPKANRSGSYDDSMYSGGRAITLTVKLGENPECGGPSMQDLFDRLAPFFVQDRRSVLSWVLPGETANRRETIVRGVSFPQNVSGKHPTVVLGFRSETGAVYTSPVKAEDGTDIYPQRLRISPSADIEAGRSYDLTFDRTYPPSNAVGSRSLPIEGTDKADWVLRIYGACTGPSFLVNGTLMYWPSLEVTTGGWFTVDTAEETMLYLDDEDQPVLDKSNFAEWEWPDMLLDSKLNPNQIRFDADEITSTAYAEIEWSPHWA